MPGKAAAVHSGAELRDKVIRLGTALGLMAKSEVRVGRRLWGAVRCIDVVLTRTETGKTLGIECKYQGGGGSAEEKVPATIQDIAAWPIDGIVVFGGDGFSANMIAYFHSTGKAVSLEDLEQWLRLYFGLS
jgi:PD-(D/E)XK nuclease superfamily protein